MNFLKKLFGVQDAPTDPKQEEEKNFEMFKYDGVRALQQHQFEYAAKCFDHALELNADDLECRDYLSRACIATGALPRNNRAESKSSCRSMALVSRSTALAASSSPWQALAYMK